MLVTEIFFRGMRTTFKGGDCVSRQTKIIAFFELAINMGQFNSPILSGFYVQKVVRTSEMND